MKDKILELRNQGYSYNQIVEELGCSKGTVAYHCGAGQKEKSLERVKSFRAGESGPKKVKTFHKCMYDLCDEQTSTKYCSSKCSSDAVNYNKIQSYLDGTWDGTVSTGLSHPISIYLKEQAGWRCQSPDCCVSGGWSVVNIKTGKVPVEIDHIDGNCYNNKIENLVVLCPNCHSITETYKALNKNSGRTYRSKHKQFV